MSAPVDTTPQWTPPAYCECWAFPADALCSYCQLAKRRAGQMAVVSASHEIRAHEETRTDPMTSSDWDRLEDGPLQHSYPGQALSAALTNREGTTS
jgi:hypothetical protein